MLAGCGSTENHVRNHGVGVASTSAGRSAGPGDRIAVDTICACPWWLTMALAQPAASELRIALKCELIAGWPTQPSTVPARFTTHGDLWLNAAVMNNEPFRTQIKIGHRLKLERTDVVTIRISPTPQPLPTPQLWFYLGGFGPCWRCTASSVGVTVAVVAVAQSIDRR